MWGVREMRCYKAEPNVFKLVLIKSLTMAYISSHVTWLLAVPKHLIFPFLWDKSHLFDETFQYVH